MNHPFFLLLVKVTIFSLMLSLGISLSFEKMLSLWRKPALLFRSLLAVVVLVPLVVVLLLKLFNLPLGVMMGLALLAVSPGAPLATKRSQMAGAIFHQSASLQLTLALLAVFITPLSLAIFGLIFPGIEGRVTILDVAEQVTVVQFLPVALGLLLQKFTPKFAMAIAKPLTIMANGLFLIMIVLACVVGLPIILRVWGWPLVAIAILVIASLGIGHALGEYHDEHQNSVLAIACIARNVGLALFIAVLNEVEQQVLPTLIAYLVVGALLGILYSIWIKRKLT